MEEYLFINWETQYIKDVNFHIDLQVRHNFYQNLSLSLYRSILNYSKIYMEMNRIIIDKTHFK